MSKNWIAGLCLIVSGLLTAQVNLTQSLTACYALDGNANDQINNLTGTLSAVTPTVDRLNNTSSALEFSGNTGSFVELPNHPLLKPSNAISFSAWIKPVILTNQYLLMTRNPAGSNFEAYCLSLENVGGQLRAAVKKGDGSGNATVYFGTNNLALNTWHHLVITMDNSSMSLYSNGTLVASGPVSFVFNYFAGKTIVLGGTNDVIYNAPFKGSMDNIRFYNRILNASEVSQLYLTDPACVDVTALSSNNAIKQEIRIFPNPSNGKFNIKSIEQINTIEVYDIVGNLVLQTNDKTEINLGDKPTGVYFVRVKVGEQVITQKIIKD
jgi:hypothetical protein